MAVERVALLALAVVNARRRRFPTAVSVEEPPACYIVKDANGFALAYIYYEDEAGRRTTANLMTQDEALRICRQRRQAADVLKRC